MQAVAQQQTNQHRSNQEDGGREGEAVIRSKKNRHVSGVDPPEIKEKECEQDKNKHEQGNDDHLFLPVAGSIRTGDYPDARGRQVKICAP